MKTTAATRRVSLDHAFVQNLRRGQYELGLGVLPKRRLAEAFAELARMI